MIRFSIGGKTVRPEEITKELMAAATKAAAEELRERIGSIRHPRTGEFPTVVVRGDSLNDMSFLVEGSPELLDIVRDRLTPEELQAVQFPIEAGSVPRVFLSYASEDVALAEMIAIG